MKLKIKVAVTWKDCDGNIIKTWLPGTIVEATADMGGYWVTSMGGVYKDEADII